MQFVHKRKQQPKEKEKDIEYEVDKIVNRKMQNGKTYYQIQWKGFSASEATWEPIQNLVNCQSIIKDYEMPKKDIATIEKAKAKEKVKPKQKQNSKAKDADHINKAVAPPMPYTNTHQQANKKPIDQKKTDSKQPLNQLKYADTEDEPSKPQTNPKINLKASRVKKLFQSKPNIDKNTLKISKIDGAWNQSTAEAANHSSPAQNINNLNLSQISRKKIQPIMPSLTTTPIVPTTSIASPTEASIKRSLSNHLNTHNQRYQTDAIYNNKGRKIQKRLDYVEETVDTPNEKQRLEIKEKLIKKLGPRQVEKNCQIVERGVNLKQKDKTNIKKERQQQKSNQKGSFLLKFQDKNSQQLNDKRLERQQPEPFKNIQQNLNKSIAQKQLTPIQSLPTMHYQGQKSIFNSLDRFNILDKYLVMQKRTNFRNIIHKHFGEQQEKQRLKLYDIGDISYCQQQLKQFKIITREINEWKLESLMKFNYGWVAVGRHHKHGPFIVDVNLLQNSMWAMIEDKLKN